MTVILKVHPTNIEWTIRASVREGFRLFVRTGTEKSGKVTCVEAKCEASSHFDDAFGYPGFYFLALSRFPLSVGETVLPTGSNCVSLDQ